MVAKIDTNDRLDKTLNYNEKKVQQGSAELIYSSGFLKDTDRLSFADKFERFQRQNELRPTSQVNTLHAKVSFDPSEKLSNETLSQIAQKYMEGIGFGDQPYVVYRHNDTKVPHMHIVSTMITQEGKRIRDYKIGEKLSEPTREAIEKEFGLVRARHHAQEVDYKMSAVDLEKVAHGEEPTKKAIQNRLKTVLEEYNVTSLAELNAVLRGYNIQADPGQPGSQKREHRGLTYKVQDDKGHTAGIPIKASDLSYKPTLNNLEEKFKQNRSTRKENVEDLRNRVSNILHQQPKSLEELSAQLRKDGIDLVIWSNDAGRPYGITFVDHQNKIAVKGSEMGREFSAKAILTTVSPDVPGQNQQQSQKQQQQAQPGPSPMDRQMQQARQGPTLPHRWPEPSTSRGVEPAVLAVPPDHNPKSPHLLSDLLKSRSQADSLPPELSQDKKKKKKKKRSL